jgi:hypothetical protein
LAGIEAAVWEDRVDIRIAVPDATSGESLVQRLARVFDVPSVSLDGGRKEVRVQSERELDRAVIQVLDAVGGWLEHDGVVSADMRLGERSYTLAGAGHVGGDL